MTDRENFISIARRSGFERIPVSLNMCPSLAKKFEEYTSAHPQRFNFESRGIEGLSAECASPDTFLAKYYPNKSFAPGTNIDAWGVAHEPGSAAAFHMTYMHHPMEDFDSVAQLDEYPLPEFDPLSVDNIRAQVEACHRDGAAAMGSMQCTIWETAWYMRGMENLMCDMMEESEFATALLDRVTESAILRAKAYAKAGCDAIFLGDDIGMQHTIMMSITLYEEWLGPRLKRVIDAARAEKPDVLIFYHSCGRVTELIPSLIRAGIDVLDPVQPECMDFADLHDRFGDQLSFHGTIGTQSVMPFGTPDEVRRKVFENLEIAGRHGGLLVCPTHMLEPEVPLENVLAYLRACEDFA